MTIVGTLGVFGCKTSGDTKKETLGFSMVTMKKALITKVLITFLFIGGLTGGIVG